MMRDRFSLDVCVSRAKTRGYHGRGVSSAPASACSNGLIAVSVIAHPLCVGCLVLSSAVRTVVFHYRKGDAESEFFLSLRLSGQNQPSLKRSEGPSLTLQARKVRFGPQALRCGPCQALLHQSQYVFKDVWLGQKANDGNGGVFVQVITWIAAGDDHLEVRPDA